MVLLCKHHLRNPCFECTYSNNKRTFLHTFLHKGNLFHSDEPWHTFSFDITGPFQQRSIHGSFYMSALMDTASKYVFDDYLQDKDEVHDKISWFLETYITALRVRTGATYEIILLTDLGEAHSNKIIKTCRKYGVLKQTTAGYTPDHNAFSERFFRSWRNVPMPDVTVRL